jgi:plastocyanin
MFTLRSFCVYSSLALLVFSCGSSDQQEAHAIQQQQPVPAVTQTVVIPAGATSLGTAAYGTNPLNIAEGSSIIWENEDTTAHSATSTTGAWDTGSIQPGASSSPIPFNSPGVFPYGSTIAGDSNMSGTLDVASPSPTPSPSVSVTPTPSPSVSPTPTPSPTVTILPTSPTKK